ncbi:beta-ketoacyl synthase N-terminal-like domain-containing protein [Aurantibacillus circumpalustris]|uniref:beta-ketoacyl synthase N-terminal-like domain-containing protein n=1 Tax=Aurantibacillus circumpalustris TaxID=3036359 RepID=UPI00295B883B|nr:beta-ketoacyl synthase N-terminal-like domain-containing protein [Aurantibacillus circumpalustris]
MEAYINSLACISPHNTISADFFFEETSETPTSNFLAIVPPVYKDYIPVNTIRRTSHILKMGISAGLMCLRNSGKEETDAIIVGTAMGCYEDTDKFLRSIDDNNERMLTPTSFIQSTHNTVAGQIALLVKCHGYNFTYVHQNLSFEYSLLDALLLLKEGEAQTVLVGGVDELNPPLKELFERAGHIKKVEDLQEKLWESKTKGYVAGEGACFFNLSLTKQEKSIAKISGVKTIQKISDSDQLKNITESFLKELGLSINDISLVLSGINGNVETDKHLKQFSTEINLPLAYFKNLCGEYFTCSSFALWFSATILQKQKVPTCALPSKNSPENIKHILIVNYFADQQYSLMCISQC